MRRAIKIDPVDLAPRDRRRIGDEFTARVRDLVRRYRDGYWFEDK